MITNDTRTHRFILEASLQSIATRFVMQQGDRLALEVNKIEMLQLKEQSSNYFTRRE